MATQEIGLNEALEAAGHRRLRDRPRRADRPARRRPAQPHPGAGDPPQPRRDPRDLPARDGRRAPAPGASPTSRRDLADGRPARTCARSSCAPRSAISGANFAVAETGTLVVVESEGNGRMCLTLPRDPDHRHGHREARADAGDDLEVFLQLLPALLHRRADEPVHLDVDRRHARRRAAGRSTSCCSTTGAPTCSPTRSAAQALRCIRCSACLNVCPVYERTGGHAYGSVYPGPIGAILTPQLTGRRRGRSTTRCRTPPRCAAPASRSARCGSTSPTSWSTCAARSSTRRRPRPARTPRRSAMRARGRVVVSAAGGCERAQLPAGCGRRLLRG